MYMTVPIALWGWIPLTLVLFWFYHARKAILISLFGAWMFLPIFVLRYAGMQQVDSDMFWLRSWDNGI